MRFLPASLRQKHFTDDSCGHATSRARQWNQLSVPTQRRPLPDGRLTRHYEKRNSEMWPKAGGQQSRPWPWPLPKKSKSLLPWRWPVRVTSVRPIQSWRDLTRTSPRTLCFKVTGYRASERQSPFGKSVWVAPLNTFKSRSPMPWEEARRCSLPDLLCIRLTCSGRPTWLTSNGTKPRLSFENCATIAG